MFRLYHQPIRLLPVSTRLSVRLSTSRCTFLFIGFAHDCLQHNLFRVPMN
ncbi:hypothetical protein BE21_0067 [Staphylococcus phage vB_SepS_BE21]|nr:hypothetical protein BE21_0067 [Staphylococcus phage vB_SepS_BE21]